MTKIIDEGSIEVILKKVILLGFEDKKTEMLLTFIVTKNVAKKASALWTVQTKNTTIKPIEFFHSYEAAINELQRRCGAYVLEGMLVEKYDTFGEIKGNFNVPSARKDGYVVRDREQQTCLTLVDKSKTQADTKSNSNSLESTLILEDNFNEV